MTLKLLISTYCSMILLIGCGGGSPPPQPPPAQAAASPSDPPPILLGAATLVIDRLEIHAQPHKGPWMMCFQASSDKVQGKFHVAGVTYSGKETTIDLGLQLSPITRDAPVKVSLQLDDDEAKVCGAEPQYRSEESFAAGTGVLTVSRDKFQYDVHYHMHYPMK